MTTPAEPLHPSVGRAHDRPRHPSPRGGAPNRPWWVAPLALTLAITIARLVYLALFCPYTLIEDEAHYWEWSRRLDWSYYTKGPGIALAIRAGTWLFGDTEFGVRFPAVIAAAIGAMSIAGLAADVSRGRDRHGHPLVPMNGRVAFFAAAVFMLTPITQLVGFVSTIDGPFVACWALACWAAWRALGRASVWAWVELGLALAVGFLFKYTILLLLPGLLLYAVLRRRRMKLTRSWPALAGITSALMVVGLLPVLIWNAREGWPTLRHLGGHLGVKGGDMPSTGWNYDPNWTLEFIGTQVGIVGPALALAALGAVRWMGRGPSDRTHRAGAAFLICAALPILFFYLLVTLKTEAEGNWALGGYATLMALAGWFAADSMVEYRRRIAAWLALPPGPSGHRPWAGYIRRKPEIPGQILWHVTVGYGLIVGVGMLRLDLLDYIPPLKDLAPAGRFMGADQMAAHVTEEAAKLRDQTGKEPFVVTQHYGRASQLAFYLPGHPSVLCTSSRMAGRRTQYDFWRDTSLDDPALLGRPAVMLGATPEQWRTVFAEAHPLGKLRGERKLQRPAFTGIGYLGFGAPPASTSR
ncbi:MAG: glycosyltransferase family 39 protein [Phycisphaerales bacterium]|nr:glycosyltransferase family 39 protein [Phycisphaerales bacterium]